MQAPEQSALFNAPILLISDLDDTIKISHTTSRLITFYRGLFRSSAFAGMPQLYREILANSDQSHFCIISSSPPAIRKKIERFLHKHKLPPAELILRDWLRQTNVFAYKRESISARVRASEIPVLLVGDDTEHDPEVFAHVADQFPEKVLARYVRKVRSRPLPEGSYGFYTAFDLACAELASGRLSSHQALRVGESVLNSEKSSRLIPSFMVMPPTNFIPFLGQVDDTLLEIWKKIHSKIQAIPRRKK